jgi:hypothetical protein
MEWRLDPLGPSILDIADASGCCTIQKDDRERHRTAQFEVQSVTYNLDILDVQV